MNLPTIPPQAVPPLDDRQGDTTLPALMSRSWWLPLNDLFTAVRSIASDVASLISGSVIGRGSLTTLNVLPKVGAAGALVESAVVDDGATVTATARNMTITGALPVYKLKTTGGTQPGRVGKVTDAITLFSRNVSFDGANWNIDDVAIDAEMMTTAGGAFYFFYVTPGANPRAPALAVTIDTILGNLDVIGVYKVAGTQVVGPRLTAVTAPTGGGTSVSAPAGGAVIDVQARTAINSIITAISSAGNTVDPAARTAINDIRARLAAGTGHGLTA